MVLLLLPLKLKVKKTCRKCLRLKVKRRRTFRDAEVNPDHESVRSSCLFPQASRRAELSGVQLCFGVALTQEQSSGRCYSGPAQARRRRQLNRVQRGVQARRRIAHGPESMTAAPPPLLLDSTLCAHACVFVPACIDACVRRQPRTQIALHGYVCECDGGDSCFLCWVTHSDDQALFW